MTEDRRSARFAIKWAAKAVTPPILVLAAKVVLVRLGLLRPPSPAEPEPAPAVPGRPEWEYVPEGWERRRRDPSVRGWDVDAIVEAYRAKWPSFAHALEGARPLGVNHEVPAGEEIVTDDLAAHNMLVSFAYVLALAAQGKERVSMLDWGGGIGHYYAIAKAVLPGAEIDYHCRDLPKLVAAGRALHPGARFSDDDSCLERRYDLVLASSSLQYSEEWRETVRRLAGATGGYLYVARVPVALQSSSFVVLQRAYAYGYDTEYLSWVLNREELLAAASASGLELVREFLLLAWLSAAGAPEEPTGHRGFLFRPGADALANS